MGIKNLNYPEIGSVGNWGSIINGNFKTIVDEINKIYNQINETQNLIGAGVPYVKQDDSRYFVFFALVEDKLHLRYYNKDLFSKVSLDDFNVTTEGLPTNFPNLQDVAYIDYSANGIDNGFSAIPLFTGAFVLNQSATITHDSFKGSGGTITYVRGDYIVRTESFGSIYSENNNSVQFVKYPVQDGGFIPTQVTTNPFKIRFDQVDSVTWQSEIASNSIEFTTPGFITTSIYEEQILKGTGSEVNISSIEFGPVKFKDEGDANNSRVNIHFYKSNEDNESDSEVHLAYKVTKEISGQEVTWHIDIDNTYLPQGETGIICSMYVSKLESDS